MGTESSVIILESNNKIRKILQGALQEAGLVCSVQAGADARAVVVGEESLAKPVRLGAVLDQARRLSARAEAGPAMLRFGGFTLDREGQKISRNDKKNNDSIKLTEKETALLVLLHQANGRSVDRQNLLEAVWGYGAEIDTHTLETHIYRLRQKIESDAAAPQLLRTESNGYSLKI
jgi:DNA-binding response OmpR family regulator